ncbi:hypothetical protein B0H67DRAFT_476561 [Lasiosphaeris hirsuta]|uniref:Ipa protein n=1 Tax=Lasiosphaeris hirsuta TaxID=260670 RepID=A0AA40B9L6_9PEZI|nr:hypothetical protein B0H67DRAFT_476561 [Lasiosphaeris hirsuta]
MGDLPTNLIVKELHQDLARKYKKHGAAVSNMWRSFNKSQRTACLKAGAAEGLVLKHPLDPSLGAVSKFMPEWNLRDIAESSPDFLLDLLRHRATESLHHQYQAGYNGGPGDHPFIEGMMATRNLRCAMPFPNCYNMFLEGIGREYGEAFKLSAELTEIPSPLITAMQARLIIPQSTGELILQRQMYLLQSLNIIIDDILEEGSQDRKKNQPPKKSDKAAASALSGLYAQSPPRKLALPELVTSSRDQKETLEECLELLSTEPVVLAHAVNSWFFTQPGLVPDEKGRRLPVHTDKYISPAVFEAVHSAIQGAAIWNYMDRLLELLEGLANDKLYRPIVLQEISNICHLEYSRVQGTLKRQVQGHSGSKWFKRLSNVHDKSGTARTVTKGNPEELTRVDPQLHYMLRLCQPEATAAKATDWMKKLADLHRAHPTEREKLSEGEVDTLSDLAVVIGFIQDLSLVISMPSLSRKKGQMFVSRLQELEAELNTIKDEVDLRDFAVPIDNLLEPGMAEGALKALEQFVIDKTGTKMGLLYQDMVEDCFSDLQKRYEQIKARLERKDKTEWSPLPTPATPQLEKRVEQRREKEKTRPLDSCAYEIAPPSETITIEDLNLSPQTFTVGSSAAEVFTALFDKSEARGSVTWAAFEAAMAEVGFSVVPKFGSVFTFFPPEAMAIKKSLTLHRPHQSRIEGYMVLVFSRRLKRVYGWGKETFVVA